MFTQYKRKYKEILSSILEEHFSLIALEPIIEQQFQTLKPFIRTDPYIKMNEEQFVKEKDVFLQFY